MKYCAVVSLLCLLLIPQVASSSTVISWFTDASISGSTKLTAPSGAPPTDANGTKSSCVNLTSFAGVTFPVGTMSSTTRGMIGFWIRPTEAGKRTSGGANHILLKAGTPTSNGFQISWDNSKGLLIFTMAGSSKVTSCRADISTWAAQDWHHVQVAWSDMDGNGTPVGLAIWIDKVAATSCIYGGTSFMSPPSGNNVTLGNSSSKCYMDELIFRNDSYALDAGDTSNSMNAWTTRDFYRTAPYTAVQINYMPNKVNSDPWVLCNKQKQFGLTGTRKLNQSSGTTTTDYMTNFDKMYGPEGEFDAKPYITWSITGTGATVDSNGLVTGGGSAANVTLNASFGGLTTATYALAVRPWTGGDVKPDLGIRYVERTPRYLRDGTQKWPNANQTVTTTVYFGNYGTATANNFTVTIEKATDTNNDFKVTNETWSTIRTQTFTSLAVGAETSVSQTWNWPSTNPLTTGSVWIRVTLDSTNALTEICEANNQRCEKSNAKSFEWAYRASRFSDDYNNKVVNLVGSFSDYDWYNAETDRVSRLMRDTILPTTSANGILDSIRVDKFEPWLDLANHDDEPAIQNSQYFDGMFDPWGDGEVTPLHFDNAVGHEIGHTTLGLPDLYGQCTDTDSFFVKKADGTYYGACPIYPITRWWDTLAPFSSATFDVTDEMGVSYDLIMSGCHFGQLGRMCAGLIHANRQTRNDLGDYYDGKFADYIPSTNRLQLYGANNNALTRARVYIYQIVCNGEWYLFGNRYYHDRYKFTATSNTSGIVTIPTTTSSYWDDPDTDSNDGAVSVSNPFATYEREVIGPSGATGDVFLIKIVGANGGTEFHLLPLTEVNATYLAGSTSTGTYVIRTNLTSPSTAPSAVAPIDPAGGQRPIARVRYNGVTYNLVDEWWIPEIEVTVSQGTVLSFDGSYTTDNEGFSPLRYCWTGPSGRTATSTYTLNTSGYADGDYEVFLTVIDSVRYSETFRIMVHVQ